MARTKHVTKPQGEQNNQNAAPVPQPNQGGAGQAANFMAGNGQQRQRQDAQQNIQAISQQQVSQAQFQQHAAAAQTQQQLLAAQAAQRQAQQQSELLQAQQKAAHAGQIPGGSYAAAQQQSFPTSQQNTHQQMALQQQRITEEVSNLCHLDNCMGSHSNVDSLYKKLYRLQHKGRELMQTFAGSRDKKREEPSKEVAHSDFLLKEMQDMAQDFHQETYYKRFVLAKLAYEAQYAAIKMLKRKTLADKQKQIKEITGPNGAMPSNLLDQSPERLLGAEPRSRLEQHAIVAFPQEQSDLGGALDALEEPEKEDELYGQPPHDLDELWASGGEHSAGIKSDLGGPSVGSRGLRPKQGELDQKVEKDGDDDLQR